MNIIYLKRLLLSYFALLMSFSVLAQSDTAQNILDERQDDFINNPNTNPFDLDDPSVVVKEVSYDPETDSYIVTETVNGVNIKAPTYLTFEEYIKYTTSKEMDDYWKQKANTKNLIENSNTIIPPININKQFFNKIFGSNTIDIRPQGNVEVTLGGQGQRYNNPAVPLRNRGQGSLLFDMGINMSVTGKIGDKMQLTLKYNNQTGFSFDNEFKLQYTGEEDDIIQLLEGGNVSFPLETQLITGAQSLQGFKSILKFGHLTVTSVFSEQQSQKQSLIIEDGAQTQTFEVNADQFEADKHYFLTEYFRNQYDDALAQQPNILSLITIEELEVWVTNRTNQTQNIRDVVALMDLGENNPYSNMVNPLMGNNLPSNDANDLYNRLISSPNTRYVDNVVTQLQGPNFNLNPIEDFEKTFAKLLSPSEYTFHPQLGYISLNSALQPNQVLGVAFKYTYNGQVYQVGELSRNVPPDSLSTSKALFVKMLRSTSQRQDLPTWDLMMRNIYSLGAFQISPEDFRLDIFYKDPGGGQKRFLPKGNLKEKQIIRVLSLDNLNNQGDPQADGLFDFQPGVTISPQNGRLIFPVVEPFGEHLAKALTEAGNPELVDDFTFPELYDSALFLAQQRPEKNRFVIKGRYKGRGGNVIQLNAFNLPENSVTVSMGGILLTEGSDYTVDYNIGVVTIINDALLNSGQQIKVDFENNALFGFQKRSLMAARLDYRVSDKFYIGGTVMNMAERPFSQKVNLGDDPINNTILGLDFKYGTDVPFLTKALDALPIYNTKEMSNITVQGEVAHLIPGHNRFIGKKDEATVYLDDFEGSSSGIDLKGAPSTWRLASTPKNATDKSGNIMFPEAELTKDLRYNFNRAKLAWFNIDPSLLDRKDISPPEVFNANELKANHFVRKVFRTELYPTNQNPLPEQIFTLDLQYFPEERGPYNYEDETPENGISKGLRPDGRLIDPKSRWAGMMRGIETNNFEVSNVEYVEFWMMDPFIYNDNHRGGQMHLNLGTISEDVLKDSKMLYENGLSADVSLVDSTVWGAVPKTQPITNAFDNDANLRAVQDVGFDGLNDLGEAEKFKTFIDGLNIDQAAKDKIIADPSQDNFYHYQDEIYDGVASILQRYKNYSGVENNSPVLSGTEVLSNTNTPDLEDLNRDNSLNENEAYYQYIVDLFPGMNVDNHPYIVSVLEKEGFPLYDNDLPAYKWYQFRIPVQEFNARIGNIQDFTSIQFMRMFLTNFEDSVNIRLATLELIRNQWRRYNFDLSTAGGVIPTDEDGTFFNVTQVNFEESNTKDPVNYILPPGINREQGIAANANQVIEQNEQSISANVCDLKDGDARAVFKNFDIDFRNYKRVIMDIHANRLAGEAMPEDNSLTAFIRFGVDFTENYYEYEIPLTFTADGNAYSNDSETDRDLVWPESNKIDLRLEELILAKKARNESGISNIVPFPYTTEDGGLITIKGIPDIGSVQVMMLGIRNPKKESQQNPWAEDDGLSKCAEVWFNELRLSGFDERSGSAALASVAVKLADLGNLNFSTNMHGIGFGQVDQQVDQRYQNNFVQYNFSGNLELGKFFGEKAKIRLPFYGSIMQNFSTPEFDPYQLDITSKDVLSTMNGDTLQDYKKTIQTINTRRGFNFTNVRKLPGENVKLLLPFNPSNFALTYAYTEEIFSDPFTESDYIRNHLARLDYNYTLKPKYLYPFKKMIKSRSKWLTIIKDININFFPSTLAFNTQFNRQFGELKLRQLDGEDFTLPSTFNKFFTWDRNYTFNYNPFKSLSINYGAANNSRIDEAQGIIDTKEERDEIWNNIAKGGRNTNFSQNLSVSYTLPLNKIPLLSFTSTKFNYSSSYNWIAAPLRLNETGDLVQNSLGNTMNNNQELRLNSTLSMNKLYNSIPYLKKFTGRSNSGTKEAKQKKKDNVIKARKKIDTEIGKIKDKIVKEKAKLKKIKENKDLEKENLDKQIKLSKKKIKNYKKQIKTRKKNKAKKQVPASVIENIIFKPLLMLKKVNLNYSENRATTLPGYVPQTRFFGIDDKQRQAPGWDFVFGHQPGFELFKGFDADRRDEWLDDAAAQNWVSSDTLLNQKFNQTFSKTFSLKATLEPINNLKIDLTFDQNKTQNHSQFFKKTDEAGDWEHLLPAEMGSYSVTTVTLKTMFKRYDEDWLNDTYKAFESNRAVISRRLQQQDPTSIGNYINPSDTVSPENPNYAAGYGPTSQDVLIPSFLAAYKGIDASKVNLNPFRAFPLPNWKITYNGITKMKWAKKIFSNFSIRSGYGSTMQVNSFQTNFDNTEFEGATGEIPRDSLNGNNFTQFNIPSIIISESLSPLIGIDMTFKNGLTARFDYKKTRSMAMNFTDFQMIENNAETYTLGVGYRIKGLKLPIKWKKEAVVLYNELNMRFDFSIRDNVIVNHKLDQGVSLPSSGAQTMTISPSIDYVINKQFNIRIFCDYSRTAPKTAASFPSSNTRAGVTLRFSLADF
ncbi:MAG: cell surface protein SprA [Chitinophagales bacterium]